MVDRVDTETRSRIMRRVQGKNTRPELAVRSMVHRLGYRFRLHKGELPGRPDLAFPGRRKVVFVHGCFWHGHRCKREKMPKSRVDYWNKKIAVNRARDARNLWGLRLLGWRCAIVWECEIKDAERLGRRLRKFLG